MPCQGNVTRILLETSIAAPVERCFNLARSVDVHRSSMSQSSERAVAGVTTGVMSRGDTVTWEAKHLGFTRRLTSKVIELEQPSTFRRRASLRAVCLFHARARIRGDGAGNVDDRRFRIWRPLRRLRRDWCRLILAGYMRRLLRTRNAYIKRLAESDRS